MAYNGYLIKLGGSGGTILPLKYIKVSEYNATPNQRMESEAKRSITGYLHRSTVAHTATKVEFNSPIMTNRDMDALMTLIRSAWTNPQERKLDLEYYDNETDSYKTGTFYMPDVKFNISRIDEQLNLIIYNETRFAFIEY